MAPRRSKTTEAIGQLYQADRKRAHAEVMQREHRDPFDAALERLDAGKLEAAAEDVLKMPEMARPSTNGGEMALYDYPDPDDRYVGFHLLDTLKHPNMAEAQASLERYKLLLEIGCVELDQDLASTIEPRNSIERYACRTARQYALPGAALPGAVPGQSHEAAKPGQPYWREHNVEACRLTNAAARLLSSFNEGALTLHKLRTGGKQTVVVQHVQVQDGGQAVIAGDMTTGGGGLSAPGGLPKNEGTMPCNDTIATARAAPRCLAQTRKKTPCQCPAIRRKRRCRMHGGHLTGAPRGNQHAVKHGRYSALAIAQRRRARRNACTSRCSSRWPAVASTRLRRMRRFWRGALPTCHPQRPSGGERAHSTPARFWKGSSQGACP